METVVFMIKTDTFRINALFKERTGNREQESGNRMQRTGNREQETEIRKQRTRKSEQEQRTRNRERGTENREQGTGNNERGTENRERGTGRSGSQNLRVRSKTFEFYCLLLQKTSKINTTKTIDKTTCLY